MTRTSIWRTTLILVSAIVLVYGEYVCDNDATHDNVKASRLTPNQFHKICPPQKWGVSLGQPTCGDGTAFSFFFSKPTQKKGNDQKLLIEFQGGGACWDSETCNMMSERLTFPYMMEAFVGLSCSEVQYGVSSNGGDDGTPINMLCAQQLGNVDFTEYNTIVVPYCTQDIHLGDSTANYQDGETVLHHGSHNTMSVLRWIFRNFKDPSHIALTGCSAGATPLPVVYDLLNKHYNSFLKGGRSVQINVISDSPVYLTPEYFLENALENWDPSQIMKRIGFNYGKNRFNTDYPTLVMDHVLKRGSNRDNWGIISHTTDPISLQYFQWMSGNGGDDDQGGGDNSYDTWWSELSSSLNTIQAKHHNVDTFLMDSEGHCSFGFYYALQEYGFEDWASSVFEEKSVFGASHRSVPLFLSSIFLGGLFAAGVLYTRTKASQRPFQLDDSMLTSYQMKLPPQWKQNVSFFFMRFKAFPITAAYFVATTFYFVAMLIIEGFAHPINNPSLGPSAQGLSNFGINNPTLIVYQSQYTRLISSNFLCSGVLTYMMVVFCLWKHTKVIEECVDSSKVFGLVAFAIMMGPNLLYALVMDGATCASLSLVLGLNSFSIVKGSITETAKTEEESNNYHEEVDEPVVSYQDYLPPNSQADTSEPENADNNITMHSKGTSEFPRPWGSTIFCSVLACVLFPFNSWVVLLTGLVIGSFAPLLLLWDAETHSSDLQTQPTVKPRSLPWKVLGILGVIMLLLLVFRVRKPDKQYKYPFLTGCDLAYTSEVGDIVSNYAGGNDGDRRHLGEDGSGDGDAFENSCAQFCIPHIASLPALWGFGKFAPFSVARGKCENNGYQEHVADKTFSFASYSLDVELYSAYSGEQE